MTTHTVILRNVTKRFGDLVAVDDVSLEVHRGEVLGLLGPNGAGKSTLINITTGLISPDTGSIIINGHDMEQDRDKTRRFLGVIPQDITLYDHLTTLENMEFFAVMNGLMGAAVKKRVQELIRYVDLDPDSLNKETKFLSGGMKRRVNIACGIMHDPEILFLDEPTAGLDVTSRLNLWNLVRKFNKEGKTIVLTTHLMDEAEELCDRIAILDHGKIVALDTPKALLSQIKTREAIEMYTHENPARIVDDIAKIDGVVKVTVEEAKETHQMFLRALVENVDEILPEIVSKTVSSGVRIRQVHVTAPSLADVFMQFTGRRLYEDEMDNSQQEIAMEGH